MGGWNSARPVTGLAILATIMGAAWMGCTIAPRRPVPVRAYIEPRHLMGGLIIENHRKLLYILMEEPVLPETWRAAESHAALLAEAGEILLRHRHATEGAWDIAANAMKEGGDMTLRALATRSIDGARRGFEKIHRSCSTCHKECGAMDAPPWSRVSNTRD